MRVQRPQSEYRSAEITLATRGACVCSAAIYNILQYMCVCVFCCVGVDTYFIRSQHVLQLAVALLLPGLQRVIQLFVNSDQLLDKSLPRTYSHVLR